MNKKNYFIKILSVLTLAASLTACGEGLSISPTYDGGILIKTQKRTPPRIKSLDYYPKSTARKDDVITFTVDAANKAGDLLQFSWKCSKGTLLSNSGTTVSWKPERGDGSLESGTATITVTVSDGTSTADASANVFISGDGRVSETGNRYDSYPVATPTPYYTPYPVYRSTPYPSSDNRSYDNDYSDNYRQPDYNSHNGNVLFEEDFESGYLDDNWTISYVGSNRRQYLTWKKVPDDIRQGNTVINLTGPTDDVLADTCSSEVRITSQAIDLRNAKLPRLTFETRSFANPANSVKLNVYWSHEGRTPRSMNVSFIPDKNWNNVDLDLQNLLSEDGGSVGLLTIGATVCNNKNEFKGPMIDNIKIYDAR